MNTVKSIIVLAIIGFIIVGASFFNKTQEVKADTYRAAFIETKIHLPCPFPEGSHLAFTARCPGTYQHTSADFVIGEDHVIEGYIPRTEGAKFVRTCH